ncbi:hypothetical protein QTP88_012973 [Uroleucon formosanum]
MPGEGREFVDTSRSAPPGRMSTVQRATNLRRHTAVWKPSVFGVVMLYIYPVDPNLFEKRRQIRF